MDEIQRLSELLAANQRYEEQKQQRFQDDLAQWNASIDALYAQVESWLQPLVDAQQTHFEYEPHLAQGRGYPDENSPFMTRRMSFFLGGHEVAFVPEAMGSKGQVSLAVAGLSLHGQEKYTLQLDPMRRDWLLKKSVGVKDSEPLAFTADYFGKLLQAVVPQRQG
ncbi:hypothetical protein [Pseudomonas sp. UBA1879]|uniref:hypothetical protein n=1 Tax=Pseudomonas sp. UBA1879 TaxID=1947305 RepID=UPI0025F489C3|nr:hypothetical protein [Pseudomonas sp. UBA1879]